MLILPAPFLPTYTLPQHLLAGLLPLAAMVYLFPSRFHALALHRSTYAHTRPQPALAPHHRWHALRVSIPLPAILLTLLEELSVWLRGIYLAALFAPVVLSAPLVFGHPFGLFSAPSTRAAWMDLLLWTIERAGPAFIKWAQWSSSRPDLFPQDVCKRFERLQVGERDAEVRLPLAAWCWGCLCACKGRGGGESSGVRRSPSHHSCAHLCLFSTPLPQMLSRRRAHPAMTARCPWQWSTPHSSRMQLGGHSLTTLSWNQSQAAASRR